LKDMLNLKCSEAVKVQSTLESNTKSIEALTNSKLQLLDQAECIKSDHKEELEALIKASTAASFDSELIKTELRNCRESNATLTTTVDRKQKALSVVANAITLEIKNVELYVNACQP